MSSDPSMEKADYSYVAPRCFGTCASFVSVSEAERKSRSYRTLWFSKARY